MNCWLLVAALNGFLAVAIGAFGAHGLSGRLDAHAMQTFETAARYHMYHTLAMCFAALCQRGAAAQPARWAAGFFLAGIVLFSGSLYLYAVTAFRPLAIVTPIGGLAFLMGWASLALAAMKVSA